MDIVNRPYRLAAGFWGLIIIILLTLPSRSFSDANEINIPYLDKLVHFMLFGILYFLVAKASQETQTTTSKWVYLIYVCMYAVFTELLQLHLIDRSFEIFDIIANIMGATIAYLFFNLKQN